MSTPATPWQQRLPPDVDRKLARVEAAARESLLETHAELACDMVAVFAPRMPFDEAIDRYLETMALDRDEEEAVGSRAVAFLARRGDEAVWRDSRTGLRGAWKWITPMGAVRFIRRQRERSSEEALWLELLVARAEERLVRLHGRHALRFVALLEAHADPIRAVHLYLRRLDVPDLRAHTVYQRVMARLADSLLPRLEDEDDDD
jgi:hypothetical protein